MPIFEKSRKRRYYAECRGGDKDIGRGRVKLCNMVDGCRRSFRRHVPRDARGADYLTRRNGEFIKSTLASSTVLQRQQIDVNWVWSVARSVYGCGQLPAAISCHCMPPLRLNDRQIDPRNARKGSMSVSRSSARPTVVQPEERSLKLLLNCGSSGGGCSQWACTEVADDQSHLPDHTVYM